jgi:hypothetical protein
MCLRKSHIYKYVLLLFTELVSLPTNAIRIKCHDLRFRNLAPVSSDNERIRE